MIKRKMQTIVQTKRKSPLKEALIKTLPKPKTPYPLCVAAEPYFVRALKDNAVVVARTKAGNKFQRIYIKGIVTDEKGKIPNNYGSNHGYLLGYSPKNDMLYVAQVRTNEKGRQEIFLEPARTTNPNPTKKPSLKERFIEIEKARFRELIAKRKN
jgi:hypothetical protein